ncbi:TlpA family protein disulfide reductase [candidate division KSB1 bacterium]|nr:TlpA family protein disulfide reductase [candidate division KSB1 bacterium]NIR69697.1 TlpA family protein disulfide reductase [candidate division KSB1 bacterium]NIS24893.1 TlpA family protein disulfide reductase [candidate division KSB1 bacterium]NIT69742.1 TlpA family protein disulfide reductase [candidate division KSB1 bacterium]NIU23412.1 TlpA family protein disulfide reductase [candidate division KSB1 bacterium]
MNKSKVLLTGLLCLAVVSFLRNGKVAAQSCGQSCQAYSHNGGGNLDSDTQVCTNYCSEFSACSIDRDLSGASGEELERYKQEKAQDGQTFSDWTAPDFTLPSTKGKRVSLSDFRGQSVVLIFMSGHCNHCFDTHKFLPDLQEKYRSNGLVVLPVYINSGSVEDVRTWSKHMDLNYPLLVSQSRDISRLYNSRMVPSFFLIDREGKINRKFVGYKSKSTLDEAFQELVNL